MVRKGGGIVKGLSPLCMKMSEDKVPRLVDGDTLYRRFQKINEAAPGWLKDLGKNGFKHSAQLERYLVDLTGNDKSYWVDQTCGGFCASLRSVSSRYWLLAEW